MMHKLFDLLLRFLLPVLAVLQVVAGSLHDLTGLGESIPARSAATETAAVPAAYAFAIWSVIFLWCFAFAIYQALPSARDNALLARLRGPAATAFALNIVWQVNAQLNGLGWMSFAIIVALLAATLAGVARVRQFDTAIDRRERWIAVAPLHVLAGWISVATFAHLSSTMQLTGALQTVFAGTLRDVTMVVAATAVALFVAVRARDPLPYAATACWGLAGIVAANLLREPNGAVAAAAFAGIATVGAGVLLLKNGQRRTAVAI